MQMPVDTTPETSVTVETTTSTTQEEPAFVKPRSSTRTRRPPTRFADTEAFEVDEGGEEREDEDEESATDGTAHDSGEESTDGDESDESFVVSDDNVEFDSDATESEEEDKKGDDAPAWKKQKTARLAHDITYAVLSQLTRDKKRGKTKSDAATGAPDEDGSNL